SKLPFALSILVAGHVTSVRVEVVVTPLAVDLDNVVEYDVDTSDLSEWGSNPKLVPGKIAQAMGVGCAGVRFVGYGDIVAVNGQPARGTYAVRGVAVCTSPNPRPGVDAISDTSWPSIRDETFEILQSDGITPIGTI